jgi:hypothetical protein
MNILIVDPITYDHSHSNFNATLVDAILLFSNLDKIELLLEKKQFDQRVMSRFNSNNIVQKIPLPELKKSDSSFSIILRYLRVFKTILSRLFKSKIDTVFFLASDNIFCPLFMMVLKLLFSNKKIYVVMHNNFQTLSSKSIKYKLWLHVLNKSAVGIVLSSSLYHASQKLFPKANVITVEHPVYSHLLDFTVPDKNYGKFKYDFLVLGRHSSCFGNNAFTHSVFETLNSLGQATTIMIGSNAGNLPRYPNVTVCQYYFPVDMNEYWDMILNAKFILVPEESGKRQTASGVHLDAITALTPIVAPKSGVFQDNIRGTNNMFLYENVEEVLGTVVNIENSVYSNAIKDIKSVLEELNLKSTSKKLEHIILSPG